MGRGYSSAVPTQLANKYRPLLRRGVAQGTRRVSAQLLEPALDLAPVQGRCRRPIKVSLVRLGRAGAVGGTEHIALCPEGLVDPRRRGSSDVGQRNVRGTLKGCQGFPAVAPIDP